MRFRRVIVRGIMVKVYMSSINEIDLVDLGLLPFCLPVFLHVKTVITSEGCRFSGD